VASPALEPVTLEGSFVRLEPMTMAHHAGLTAVGLDPDVWRLTVVNVHTPEEMRSYMESALRLQAEGSSLPFVTIERSSGRVVGSSRFGNYDPLNRRIEIGWTWLAPAWQRTAANTEAKYLMLTHAFERLGCVPAAARNSRRLSFSAIVALTICELARDTSASRHRLFHAGRRETL
jgi:RimJ/RimL family protein N-acetyltransferase